MRNPVARLEGDVGRALAQSGYGGGTRQGTIVVAVSGGPDSLALLYALCHLSEELGLALHCAHLDHGLRGDDSEADARSVADTSRRLGLGFTSERADVPSYRAKHRLSLEQAAREARYEFLARVAAEQRTDAVALGHTADDQAETVLMHIMRGSGLTGLRGMEPTSRRAIAGRRVLLLRPMLGLTRQDTLAYCRALHLEPRLDRSNQSTALLRNRVRLELLPALESYNPAVRGALLRLSRSASRELAYLDSQLDAIWPRAVRQGQDRVTVNGPLVQRLAPALRAHLLRRAVAQMRGGLEGVQQAHIDEMERLMDGPAGRTLYLPGGFRFTVGYGEATIAPGDTDLGTLLPLLDGEHRLQVPGETKLAGWSVLAAVSQGSRRSRSAEYRPSDPTEYAPGGLIAHLDHEAMGSQLSVRARRPGDRFQPLGMRKAKKLQDFMVDAKVGRHWRDRVPLVVSPRGIAWVVGWRIAEWGKVRGDVRPVLQLRFLPEGDSPISVDDARTNGPIAGRRGPPGAR